VWRLSFRLDSAVFDHFKSPTDAALTCRTLIRLEIGAGASQFVQPGWILCAVDGLADGVILVTCVRRRILRRDGTRSRGEAQAFPDN